MSEMLLAVDALHQLGYIHRYFDCIDGQIHFTIKKKGSEARQFLDRQGWTLEVGRFRALQERSAGVIQGTLQGSAPEHQIVCSKSNRKERELEAPEGS